MPSIAPDINDSYVHVAVAVVTNANGEVLLSLRPAHVHQGGLWEFPGGKVEHDESLLDALRREIREELGIYVENALPLMRICHKYPDKSVLLDVCCINSYNGVPQGLEGQQIRWVKIEQLDPADFPAANKNIIRALQLPDQLLITGLANDVDDFVFRLERALSYGIRLIQLRNIQQDSYEQLIHHAKSVCSRFNARLLLNTTVDKFEGSNVDGLHLNSKRIFEYTRRPISPEKLLSVSCHNQYEIEQANRLKADILLLSPVKPTPSHPGASVLGWDYFMKLAGMSYCPVYALGGMSLDDIAVAKSHGARGIAAISCLWSYE